MATYLQTVFHSMIDGSVFLIKTGCHWGYSSGKDGESEIWGRPGEKNPAEIQKQEEVLQLLQSAEQPQIEH